MKTMKSYLMRTGGHLRRWRRKQPHTGGLWLFREDGRHCLVDYTEILLCSDGSEVEGVDDAEEGTDQYYFEMTPTNQKLMPGLWMQAPLIKKA